ncbi:trifolitoxin immunity protein [Actinomadura darangshiensis]|uniref:Trifolitoxin immunity protein n=1 Tax=Actinomadura darangshiensis TaxID=705336 RepID=A0A4R5A628_9ACTN|nr:phosphotransferase [Actinomadura darangshiensis]TDD65042.1 trifolitoxin immunity protein [Actinomadura darangshiensis]
MSESSLPGGFVNVSVRVGDTVRRQPVARSPFVHRLLGLLERAGWDGAPRFLGVDDQGREVLSFVDGHVAWEPVQPFGVDSDESLARVAELVREFHDLTAATDLAGDEEVVCHNDLSPKNTVYRNLGAGLRPVAFIDWDVATPGRRIHDVAHLCWQYVGLGPGIVDVGEAARRVRLVCDAYRLVDRGELVDVILWWQDRCWRGIAAAAAAGDPAMVRLREAEVVGEVQAAYAWVEQHHVELALGSVL